MIHPSVGRKVWYRPSPFDKAGVGAMQVAGGQPLDALRVLADDPRVSTFERGPAWLESLLSDLKFAGLIVELDEPYPWHRYALTDAGKAMITQQGE